LDGKTQPAKTEPAPTKVPLKAPVKGATFCKECGAPNTGSPFCNQCGAKF